MTGIDLSQKLVKVVLVPVALISVYSGLLPAATRHPVRVPDILEYVTLRCDFHTHTVFSDGLIWPTMRIDEAYRDGLDAIAITDHLEYKPHEDVTGGFNRPYEIALPKAQELGIILIRGVEITRSMPPGHFNALFIKDADKIHKEKWRDAIRAAADQGAFIHWNHPGFPAFEGDREPRWFDEHDWIFNQGWLHGIEVFNGDDYYELALRKCLDLNLSMMGNTDVHGLIYDSVDRDLGEVRAMTLVFSRTADVAGIKEALFDRRTAAFSEGELYGREPYLKAIWENSVVIPRVGFDLAPEGRRQLWLDNRSSIPFKVRARTEKASMFRLQEAVSISPERVTTMSLRADEKAKSGRHRVPVYLDILNLHNGLESTVLDTLMIDVTVADK